MTTAALIASDRLYRAGVGRLFEGTRFDVVATGGTVKEVIAKSPNIKPDLVLLNVDKGVTDVKGLIAQARRWASEARVVVIAPVDCGDVLNDAVASGADGTLHRDISAEALIDVLAVVMSGEPVFLGLHRAQSRPNTFGQEGQNVDFAESGPLARLSEREILVLRYLTLGLSNKDLARKLSISENTVKVHLRRICRLLHVQNRTQAALVGARHLTETPIHDADTGEIGIAPSQGDALINNLDINRINSKAIC